MLTVLSCQGFIRSLYRVYGHDERLGSGRSNLRTAEGAARMGGEPRVDAPPVEHVAAGRQGSDQRPVLQCGQAHAALALLVAVVGLEEGLGAALAVSVDGERVERLAADPEARAARLRRRRRRRRGVSSMESLEKEVECQQRQEHGEYDA